MLGWIENCVKWASVPIVVEEQKREREKKKALWGCSCVTLWISILSITVTLRGCGVKRAEVASGWQQKRGRIEERQSKKKKLKKKQGQGGVGIVSPGTTVTHKYALYFLQHICKLLSHAHTLTHKHPSWKHYSTWFIPRLTVISINHKSWLQSPCTFLWVDFSGSRYFHTCSLRKSGDGSLANGVRRAGWLLWNLSHTDCMGVCLFH